MKRILLTTFCCMLMAQATAQDTLKTGGTLGETVVAGQRAAAKLKPGRIAYSIGQQAASAGLSALEALETIPGVEVQGEGNIVLRGNPGVEVLIDGRRGALTRENRADLLQHIAAESIDRIEVITTPSARDGAEGTAGIINIVMRKERRGGLHGSAQAGVKTIGAAVGGLGLNYNSPRVEAYLDAGYRHRRNKGRTESDQTFKQTGQRQWYKGCDTNTGNSLTTRAGLTLHATSRDDIVLSTTAMVARRKNGGWARYHYLRGDEEWRQTSRSTHTTDQLGMLQGELAFRHSFGSGHRLDLAAGVNRWQTDNDNLYRDSLAGLNPVQPTSYACQLQTVDLSSRSWHARLDYENTVGEKLLVQAGYEGRFSRENTPQQTFADSSHWDGRAMAEVPAMADHFKYDMDLHAVYAAATLKLGDVSLNGGLRAEGWTVDTSLPWHSSHLQLFPSASATWHLGTADQLQLSYARRINRPYGSQLNSFHDTHDATTVVYGNPMLEPETASALELGALKTWSQHQLLLSLYWRPAQNVVQRVSWQDASSGLLHSSFVNVAHSHAEGAELTVKNRLGRSIDLTTTIGAGSRRLGAFCHDAGGQQVRADANTRFTWNARVAASVVLPFDISFQGIAFYRAREAVAQGYRLPAYGLDLGLRKNFLDKRLVLSVNSHDIFSTRKLEKVHTETETFVRHSLSNRGSRKVNFTLTWNFGNAKTKTKLKAGKVADPTDTYRGESDD